MMFSKSCEYSLQAIIYIVANTKDGELASLNDIAESQNIPSHFLSKLLQNLVRKKILFSSKGPGGGFKLKIHPNKLKLIDVVKAVDGLEIFDQCGIGLKKCSDKNPCPIHHEYKVVKEKIQKILSSKNMSEIIEDIEKGKSIISFKTTKKTGKK